MAPEVIIIGAGAAGMMCAIEAGRRGRRVLVIDHARNPGEKIRISGGGRCNFTNLHSAPRNFLSENPRFAISALSRYTPADFIARVDRHNIAWHEKTLGQLFCDGSAKEIIAMLTREMADAGCRLSLADPVHAVEPIPGGGFQVSAGSGRYTAAALVIATGGKSIPKMGATGFGYDIAARFGHRIVTPRAGLVPFTWPSDMAADWGGLSGVALPVRTRFGKIGFDEAMLLTHRGLSGPAILQISSYWREGEPVEIDLVPGTDPESRLAAARQNQPKAGVAAALGEMLPRRLAELIAARSGLAETRLADLSNRRIAELAGGLKTFRFTPGGTEGFRTAEVTLGGVDTRDLDQKTLQSRLVPGLYFIGEVVDVTGHLGGHNFQWAWASGHAAGQVC